MRVMPLQPTAAVLSQKTHSRPESFRFPRPAPADPKAGRTLVFIPAYNEDRTVGEVVHAVLDECPEVDVLVVDDGSTDDTAATARAAGARVASLPFNQGLGAALHTGYLMARRDGYNYCAHLDADGQHPAAELRRLLTEVWEGRCDLALGSRYHPVQFKLPPAYQPNFARRAGIWLFRGLLRITSGTHFTDTTSGLRAANRRSILLFAHRYQPDFGELESLQRSVREGLRISEVPVVMLPRAAGASKITALPFVFKGLLVVFIGALRRSEHKKSA
jgi:glycosyltransferase involved in cell wall biosynthesis